ncbi:MAG: metal-dependent hydrolase, partial [Nanoarchaeota archaeon]
MFAFTHLITAWLLGKGYEALAKKRISHPAWFFLLFGSLLPDIDFLIDWTLGTEFHRTFTHSLLF